MQTVVSPSNQKRRPASFVMPDTLALTTEIDQTAFLRKCRAGTVSQNEMRTFLVQHYHYARHFTRYLCALLANMNNERDRSDLCQNLFEEMGLGDLGQIPHSKIYADMLTTMGINPHDYPVFSETTELVSAMHSLCSSTDPLVGLGAICLGAEAIVPHVYRQIVTGLKSLGYQPADYDFFSIHIDGDDDHAETMRKIIGREIAEKPEKTAILTKAAQVAIQKRMQFFDAITGGTTAGLTMAEVHHVL